MIQDVLLVVGLIGNVDGGNTTVTDCYNQGSVSGTDAAGGLIRGSQCRCYVL